MIQLAGAGTKTKEVTNRKVIRQTIAGRRSKTDHRIN
jgi:hypothetical protein